MNDVAIELFNCFIHIGKLCFQQKPKNLTCQIYYKTLLEHFDGICPTAGILRETQRLYKGEQCVEKQHEEKDHKVEWTIISEINVVKW